jgi:hypothetical protein
MIKKMFDAHFRAAQAWKRKIDLDTRGQEEHDRDEDGDDEDSSKGHEGSDEGEGGDESRTGDAGIRKVRLGTFEDSDKCKGCVSASPPLLLPPTPSFLPNKRMSRIVLF